MLLSSLWFILWLVLSLTINVVVSVSVLSVTISVSVVSGSGLSSRSFFLFDSLDFFFFDWFLIVALRSRDLLMVGLNRLCLLNNYRFNWASLLLNFGMNDDWLFFLGRSVGYQGWNKVNLFFGSNLLYIFLLNFFVTILLNKSEHSLSKFLVQKHFFNRSWNLSDSFVERDVYTSRSKE